MVFLYCFTDTPQYRWPSVCDDSQ